MTTANKRMPRVAWVAAVAALALVAVGFPASTTAAYLTATAETKTAKSAIGNWCSVPNPDVSKNVYKLSSFDTVTVAGTAPATSQMLIVPVVNDGSFDPVVEAGDVRERGAQPGQLGVRVWSCTPSLTSGLNIKATAWRGNYTAGQTFTWKNDQAPQTGSFAASRLASPGTAVTNAATIGTTNPGNELRDLHRGANKLGAATNASPHPVTMRYSWLLDSYRDKNENYLDSPACASKACAVIPGTGVLNANTITSGVEAQLPSNAMAANSSTFIAEKYYANNGLWPVSNSSSTQIQCSFLGIGQWRDIAAGRTSCAWLYEQRTITKTVVSDAPVISPTTLVDTTTLPQAEATTSALLKDTTGTKVQFVVIEWSGSAYSKATLPQDLAIEVFVTP